MSDIGHLPSLMFHVTQFVCDNFVCVRTHGFIFIAAMSDAFMRSQDDVRVTTSTRKKHLKLLGQSG